MKIHCPHCGVKGSADDSYHGQKVKCPKCDGVFAAIPEMLEVPTPVETQVEPTPETSLEDSRLLSEEPAEAGTAEVVASEVLVENPADSGAEAAISEAENTPVSTQVTSPEKEEDALDWQDIVADMDKEIDDRSKRGQAEDEEPAILPEDLNESEAAATAPAASEIMEQDELLAESAVSAAEAKSPLADESAGTAATAAFAASQDDRPPVENAALEGVEDKPYGMDKEQCWQCGKKDSVGMPFLAKDGRLYCPECLPPEENLREEEVLAAPAAVGNDAEALDVSPREERYGFTIGGLLKEAWAKTKGVKATVWAGSAVMYLVLIILVACGALFMPSYQNSGDGMSMAGVLSDLIFQLITNALSVIFSAGLIFIGIRRVAGEAISWKMVFKGFPMAGKLIVAAILQTLLVGIGFLLLILPGIYLTVGYAMTIPLIIDRKMTPWQAMEASRKAIHGEWWKIFGLFIAVGLIFLVSALPLGLGFIWTWPMFIVLGALVYRALFGIEKKSE